jgi:hypothetical protein
MELFENITQDTADYKLTKWLRYVNDTFMVWPHEPARLQQFLQHLNSLRFTIMFTLKVEDNAFPFLHILVMKRGSELAKRVYQKQTRK